MGPNIDYIQSLADQMCETDDTVLKREVSWHIMSEFLNNIRVDNSKLIPFCWIFGKKYTYDAVVDFLSTRIIKYDKQKGSLYNYFDKYMGYTLKENNIVHDDIEDIEIPFVDENMEKAGERPLVVKIYVLMQDLLYYEGSLSSDRRKVTERQQYLYKLFFSHDTINILRIDQPETEKRFERGFFEIAIINYLDYLTTTPCRTIMCIMKSSLNSCIQVDSKGFIQEQELANFLQVSKSAISQQLKKYREFLKKVEQL